MNKEEIKKPKPILLAINICDQIIRDEITKKISLIGLFNTITANTFPCRLPSLHVYVAITNGHGEYNGELRFINLSNNQLIARAQGKISFSNPLTVCEFHFRFVNLEFRTEGKHIVEFCCDGSPIGRRDFIVIGPRLEVHPPLATGGV